MRVLAINSMFANRVYRRCVDELGLLDDLELSVLTVRSWKMNGREMPMEPVAVDAPYRIFIGDVLWSGKENRGFYTSGLVQAFRTSRPEVIFLMEEPFSIFAFQTLLLRKLMCPEVPVVFFTWNNLSLEEYDYRPSIFYRNVARWVLPQTSYALTANLAGIQVLTSFGYSNPIDHVGYGVDIQRYTSVEDDRLERTRQELGLKPTDFVIGYVGRLLHMKGVDLLVDAFADACARHSDRQLRLLLVGGGPESEAIRARSAARGLAEQVRQIETVPHDQVPYYTHLMDTLVLPSRRQGMWEEQFGRVLVEAMAAGKIVIGSSSGAIPEVIGDAGLVFKENDATDLQSKLSHVLSLAGEERKRLGEHARLRAVQRYSWKRFAEHAYRAIRTVHNAHSV